MVLSLWVALLGVTTTAAGPGSLVVTEAHTPPNMVGLGARLTQSVIQEAEAQRRPVVDPSRLRRLLGPNASQALRECELTPTCAAPLLATTGASRAVLARLDRDVENYLVELVLVDVKTGEEITRLHQRVPIAARRLASDVSAALPAFLRGEAAPEGRLTLESSVPGARIEVDGEPRGTAPLTLSLPPGRYRVTAEVAGHYPVERTVDVASGGEHTEALRLTPLAEADREEVPQRSERALREAEEAAAASRSRREVAGCLSGAAAVSLAAGAGLHIGFESERRGGRRAVELQRARNVTLGIGAGLAVGAGLVWLWSATTGEDTPPPVTVAPTYDGERLGVGVGGRF
ncbi:MAG TPA: PEGA domain-containing protein [Myxococcaceae bacterium]|nr:PEGA domain-containing protein [Myxococcaceae bacterium]